MSKYFIYAMFCLSLLIPLTLSCVDISDEDPNPPADIAETATLSMTDVDTEAGVREFNEAFVTAWNNQDAQALSELFGENADVIDASGLTTTGRANIRARYDRMLQGDFLDSVLTVEPHPTDWLTQNVAVISGTYAILRNDETLAAAQFTNLIRRHGTGFVLEAVRMTVPLTTGSLS